MTTLLGNDSVLKKVLHFSLPYLLSYFLQTLYGMADLLIIGGTSLIVYPAAGFIDYFRGRHLVVINKSVTSRDKNADLVIQDSIGKVFEQIEIN